MRVAAQLRGQVVRLTQQGMALVECLMAMLIFSVGLVGLMGLEARVMTISTAAEDRGRASLFASEVASNMWLNKTVASATAAPAALQTRLIDAKNGGLPSGAVTVTPVAGTTNAADIVITWQPPSDPAGTSRRLSTRVIMP